MNPELPRHRIPELPRRWAPLFLCLVVALCALTSPSHASSLEEDTTYYRGGGNGIRIELRVRYHKVVYALISTTFYCTDPEGRRSEEPLRTYLGNKGLWQPNTRFVALGATPVRENGRFERILYSDGRYGLWDEGFSGRVGATLVTGTFRLHIGEDDHCRTGGFLAGGGVDRERESLEFRATRVETPRR